MKFEQDFASTADFARIYRDLHWQIVPAGDPRTLKAWKRPIVKWRGLENTLISDDAFAQWFGEDGEYVRGRNIGIVCGACSGGIFVVDLDLHKDQRAEAWWREMGDKQERLGDLETVHQRTGGGGLQYLFRAPAGWTPPTIKTEIGVDIRGQGGFAMLAPSVHESGRQYEWVDGYEPWNFEIAEAPRWLTAEIDILAREFGGSTSTGPRTRTDAPDATFNSFGKQVDSREHYARDLVWSIMVDLRRDAPIPPARRELDEEFDRAFAIYEGRVKSRLPPRLGATNADLLEEEGRGRSMLKEKWDAAFRQWDTKVSEASAEPKPEKPRAGGAGEGAGGPFVDGGEFDATDGQRPSGGFPVIEAFPIVGADIPPRDWAAPGLFMHGHLSLTVAPGGSGKSMLEVHKAIMMATGREWAGWTPRKRERVLLINAEDDYHEMSRRLYAAATHMGVDQEDLKGWVFLAREPDNIVVAQVDPKTKAVIRTQLFQQLVNTIVEQDIGVVIADPFAETFIGDENANSEVKWAAIAWREIARITNAAVHLVHHTRKYASQMAGDSDASRGGGALVNAARLVSTLFTMTDEEAEKLGVDPEQRHRYVRHDDAKANLTLISANARWFEKIGVKIPNGRDGIPSDEIGVLSPWEPPGAFDGIQTSRIHACLDAITGGIMDDKGQPTGQFYTFSKASSGRYVGRVIADTLNVNIGQAERITGTWRQTGLIFETYHLDERKRPTKIVKVDEAKRPGRAF